MQRHGREEDGDERGAFRAGETQRGVGAGWDSPRAVNGTRMRRLERPIARGRRARWRTWATMSATSANATADRPRASRPAAAMPHPLEPGMPWTAASGRARLTQYRDWVSRR